MMMVTMFEPGSHVVGGRGVEHCQGEKRGRPVFKKISLMMIIETLFNAKMRIDDYNGNGCC